MMKRLLSIVLFFSFGWNAHSQKGKPVKLNAVSNVRTNRFDFVTDQVKASIVYANDETKLDSIAAYLLAADIERVTGYLPQVSTDITTAKGNVIVIGTIHSSLMTMIAGKSIGKVDKWECYGFKVVSKPLKNINQALVITGSDARGTAYGVFSISERIGVSPWYWWADVKPAKQKMLSLQIDAYISQPPSVKYRGIFINDEDWGLQPWAAKTFEPETKDIGPKTYAKVFELLLRLKANFIWTAMHPSTKAFFHYPGNAKMAELYQIVIGSSHAEPMLRNNVGEWDEKTMGHFNYFTNKEKVAQYWEDRVKESSHVNAIYSLGMRGVHDSPIEGVKGGKDAVPVIEQIFEDQRNLFKKYINKDVTKVPQVFTPYKEVLDIYASGLKVPDDVTLMWPDDNYGYIQRLSNDEERKRSGGAGVYYHASYWGRPHDYLWLSTTHPSLIREEMMKAFATNAKNIWVLNVGDIKPAEYNIQLFMDMAYRVDSFYNRSYPRRHLQQWAACMFGEKPSKGIADALWNYYDLAWKRKPEFMGWSQTEPTTKTNYTQFNHFSYGDEAQRRIDHYQALEDQVKKIRKQIPTTNDDAFYELVYYPVVGASLMNKKFLYHDKAYVYAKQNRASAADYAQMSQAAYDSIVKETDYYNNQLVNGKWKNIMSMKPRDLPVYLPPAVIETKISSTDSWGIVPEGFVSKDSTLPKDDGLFKLPSFDPINKQQYFIDIFLSVDKAVAWQAVPSAVWIKLSKTSGQLTPSFGNKQTRIYVTIDWTKAPKDAWLQQQVLFKADGKQISVAVNYNNIILTKPINPTSFIENNGRVSINAGNYTRKQDKGVGDWSLMPDFGYSSLSLSTGNVLAKDTAVLRDTNWLRSNSSYVEYDFYTISSGKANVTIFSVPTQPLNYAFSMRYAVSVDDGPIRIVDFRTASRSEEWKQNVLRNRAERTIPIDFLGKGNHRLRIYSVDPGVILDAVSIDFGGAAKAYDVLQEGKKVSL